MDYRITVATIYNCTLEQAFKTPILSDVTKVHTGLLVMPRVTHCANDSGWGQPGSAKQVFVAPSLTQKGGFASVDKVVERIENQYWKIQVADFQAWMLGFYQFTGEWATREIAPGEIEIIYTYTLHANSNLLMPLQWLFAKLFWPRYMRQVLENIRNMIQNKEPYLFP